MTAVTQPGPPGVDGRFVGVPAAYVYLRNPAGEVLLQLRRDTGYMDGHWAAGAAGHVERGESAYAAARRETREELGVEVEDLEFELTMHRTQGDLPIDERVDWFFTARSWTGTPRIMEPHKIAELRWCRLDDLPQPMVPHEAQALSLLGTRPGYVSVGFPDEHP